MNTPDPVPDRPADDDLVTVCDACLQSSCWHGIFMCEESKNAGTVQKTVRELRLLALEHSDYWVTRYWRGAAYTGMSVPR